MVVGVDLGGTRLRARLIGAGRARTLAAPAPALVDLPATLRRLLARAGARPAGIDALVVAARSVWTPAERRAARRRLAPLARRVLVISDVEAAHHGALRGGHGALVLAGTGSIVLARGPRGWRRAGGLGPLFGDEGSGFAIGRDWLRHGAAAGPRAARRLSRAPDAVARIAGLAPRVLARAAGGHAPARRVVADAQAALAAQLAEAVRGLGLPRPIPVSWAGGLMGQARFRAGVWRAARRAGLAVRPLAPAHAPVHAAAAIALRAIPSPHRGEGQGEGVSSHGLRRPPHPALRPTRPAGGWPVGRGKGRLSGSRAGGPRRPRRRGR